ncbi:arabinan endo-1,5-alpha-L-arabinosidase [Microbacterium terricola]|uniref:Arabinan endo-1,5-alpha-L-arabinosidase n=2 Tax=Microbacterium terricola TaxID=344163 RepID=A0ABM8E2K8_9MICO|nr:arabinan endo-1,5-alpha-L-arabinosidase [Microbacterium terricola]
MLRAHPIVALAVAAAAASALLTGCAPAASGARELTGDLATHDPAYAVSGDVEYVYSTGDPNVADGNIQIRSSADGTTWNARGAVWDEKPDWLSEAVPGVSNLWAPELIEHDGTWYLYYAASTFGQNTSVIALATNTTLDPDDPDYRWVDRGEVISSSPADDFNAIDPGVIVDEAGDPWLAFGSFWSGIRMVSLQWPDGGRADAAEPLRLADRGVPPNAIEAPYIVEHDGDYFLFVSFDSCCKALASTYRVMVGRADAVTGPYVDRAGVPLLEGGGTSVLEGDGQVHIGPGGQSSAAGTLAVHYYDGRLNGAFQLALLPLVWDAEGWPTVTW